MQAQVYLAAERTFLAWIRTGLVLMGFGFVVARFGLVLRELNVSHFRPETVQGGVSLRLGVALVMLGVVLTAAAGLALAIGGAVVAVYLLVTP